MLIHSAALALHPAGAGGSVTHQFYLPLGLVCAGRGEDVCSHSCRGCFTEGGVVGRGPQRAGLVLLWLIQGQNNENFLFFFFGLIVVFRRKQGGTLLYNATLSSSVLFLCCLAIILSVPSSVSRNESIVVCICMCSTHATRKQPKSSSSPGPASVLVLCSLLLLHCPGHLRLGRVGRVPSEAMGDDELVVTLERHQS